eukprot:TRINITY_DN4572_c0_g3_i2.p1 TRINITY_DN4572_c0_g3~~TRINITY_DN4572_c0_g3_i2.p1  ORF type:complete len:891 (+),score=157.24 TRINITY_DN4572_c0_g3_i2:363-3035(+)
MNRFGLSSLVGSHAQHEELDHYTARIKDIFWQADAGGKGVLSRADLERIIWKLDSGCAQDEINQVLDLLDRGDGFASVVTFVDWLMEEESHEYRARLVQELGNAFDACDAANAPAEEDADDDAAEGVDMLAMENEPELPPLDVDLQQIVDAEVWPFIAARMGIDAQEAETAFQHAKSPPADSSVVTMASLMRALSIDENERDGLDSFNAAMKNGDHDYRAQRQGNGVKFSFQSSSSVEVAELTMFNKVVRTLDKERAPPDQAWQFIMEGRVLLAEAEQRVAAQFENRTDEFISLVKHYSAEPPLVNATAGQLVVSERCTAEVESIIAKCKKQGIKYTDLDWDVQKDYLSVLYVDHAKPGYDCTVGKPAGYERLTEIVKNSSTSTSKALGSLFGRFAGSSASKPPLTKPILFKDGIQAGDIVQGNIGTCFLLGAIGAIASKGEKAIESMFIRWDVDVGVYGIRLNVDGEWTYVIVDDYMPVNENGRLIYGSCKDPQEVWVPLLEKAFCKMHTCYEMCDGGHPSEAIAGFMGGVGGRFQVKNVHRRNPERYFKVLKQAKDKGWLLTTGFRPRQGGGLGAGKCGEAVLPTGLVVGHAYSVLKVLEAHGNMLVCCMNPWGSGEWTGKWSGANAYGEWTPEMIKATGAELKDDGKFWMCIEDFVANTAGVDYARTFGPNWKKMTQYARFQASSLSATVKEQFESSRDKEISLSIGDHVEVDAFASNGWWRGTANGMTGLFPCDCVELSRRPVARFDLHCISDEGLRGDVRAVVMMIQPDAPMQRKWNVRADDGLTYKDTSYPHMQLVVIGPQNDVAIKNGGRKRCLWGDLTLQSSGLWKIYALAADGNEAAFALRVYLKGCTGTLREISETDIAEVAEIVSPKYRHTGTGFLDTS